VSSEVDLSLTVTVIGAVLLIGLVLIVVLGMCRGAARGDEALEREALLRSVLKSLGRLPRERDRRRTARPGAQERRSRRWPSE
jgi:hypothetical protein